MRIIRTAVLFVALLAGTVLRADTRMGGVAGNTTTTDWSTGVSYTYDPSGNVTGTGSDRYAYDEVGRLVRADVNGVTRTYSYDAFGNRKTCQQAGTDCQYGVKTDPATNRSSLKPAGGAETLLYDARGNLLNLGSHTYAYDAVNMMTRDAASGGATREFVYTADDERLATYTVGGSWSWTVRSVDGKVLREFTSSNGTLPGNAGFSWTRDNIYRDGLLLATRQPVAGGVTTYRYHLDHLGTPRQVTDDSDLVVGVHDYYAFGPEAPGGKEEPGRSRLRYTGHERDLWLNESIDTLDYMHARSSSPVLGRFLSVDPVLDIKAATSNPQGWNRYAYVRNNPVRFTDPTGRYQCEGSKGDCAAIKQAWRDLRKAASNLPRGSSERGSVNQVLSFLGRPGQRNGVTVTIGRGMIERTSGGATINTHSAPVGPTGFTFQLGLDLNRIALSHGGRNSTAFAPEVAAALGHEGQHGIDLGRAGRMFQFESQVSESETNAYTLDAAVYRGLNFESSWGLWTRSGGINQQAIDDAVAQSVTDWLTERLRQ